MLSRGQFELPALWFGLVWMEPSPSSTFQSILVCKADWNAKLSSKPEVPPART